MNQEIRPLGTKIVVRRDVPKEKTEGGIVLPDMHKKKPNTGVVVSVGPGCLNEHNHERRSIVNVGDHVLFNEYGATEVKVGAESLLVIDGIEDVVAVLV